MSAIFKSSKLLGGTTKKEAGSNEDVVEATVHSVAEEDLLVP